MKWYKCVMKVLLFSYNQTIWERNEASVKRRSEEGEKIFIEMKYPVDLIRNYRYDNGGVMQRQWNVNGVSA